MSDDALVRQAQRGDLEAFEALIHRHEGAIISYLHRFMPNRDDTEDLAQEVFIKAYQSLSRFDPTLGQFRSWLFRIAANTSLDELKRRKRVVARNKKVAAQLDGEVVHGAWNPETELDQVTIIQSALQSIPDAERQVVLLSYYHDISWREIANTLGIPLGTVKSRMHSALSRLRQLIISMEDGELR